MAIENIGLYPITIDVYKKHKETTVQANDNDSNGRGLLITLVKDGVPFNSTGINLKIGFRNAVGEERLYDCDTVNASEGKYKVFYPTEMLQGNGGRVVKLEVKAFEASGALLNYAPVFVYVSASEIPNDSIGGGNKLSTLVNALSQVQGIDNRFGEVNAQLAHTVQQINYIGLIPNLKTSLEDPAHDNVQAIKDAINSIKDVGGTLYIPNRGDVYLLDPSKLVGGNGIVLYPNIKIVSNGATLKLKSTTYTNHFSIFITPNYVNGGYDANIPVTNNISIDGLIIDGNTENLTTNSNYSVTGINAYKVKNFTVKNTSIKNLSGTTGAGYGLITWYSENVILENLITGATDRQNICVWETIKARLTNIICENSSFREPILLSSNTPVSLQKTEAICENIHSVNVGTGTYCLRVSGTTDVTIKDSVFESDGSLRCVYIPNATVAVTKVTFKNCKFKNGTYAIHAEGSAEKHIVVDTCEIDGCAKGIVLVGKNGTGSVILNDIKITNATGETLRVDYFKDIIVRGVLSNGFVNASYFGNFETAQLIENRWSGGQDTYVCIISSGNGSENLNFNDNIMMGNSVNSARIYTRGKAVGNVGTVNSTTLQVNEFNG